jgi:hypothetical protein
MVEETAEIWFDAIELHLLGDSEPIFELLNEMGIVGLREGRLL